MAVSAPPAASRVSTTTPLVPTILTLRVSFLANGTNIVPFLAVIFLIRLLLSVILLRVLLLIFLRVLLLVIFLRVLLLFIFLRVLLIIIIFKELLRVIFIPTIPAFLLITTSANALGPTNGTNPKITALLLLRFFGRR